MDFLRFIPYHSAKISLNDNRAKNETPFPLQSKLLKIKRMAAVILFFMKKIPFVIIPEQQESLPIRIESAKPASLCPGTGMSGGRTTRMKDRCWQEKSLREKSVKEKSEEPAFLIYAFFDKKVTFLQKKISRQCLWKDAMDIREKKHILHANRT